MSGPQRTSVGRPHAPSASQPRSRPPQERREEILGAALELFATIGYRSTTMTEIGERIGIRGPSLYKHVESKHQLLAVIMTRMMDELLRRQREALDQDGDVRERLQRITVVHVQYHAEHRYEAFVGHREIDNLEEPDRSKILQLRRNYETSFRKLIREGRQLGAFTTVSDRLSSYAILDMGIGVSAWFNPGGSVSPNELATTYASFAERMLSAVVG
ncbi:MAG TPA: TetR/AcrR family transcriptional regulator [Ilumatobacteraceae bacterium]